MYHFFTDREALSEEGKILRITGADYKHIVNVLRMKPGEEISVSLRDGDPTEYRFGITEITKEAVVCSLRFTKESNVELPVKVYLFQGIPKSDKMDGIVQKAVELGVFQVIPVQMKRTIVKMDAAKAQKRTKRWQAIAEGAAKQSQRGIIPEVLSPVTMEEAIRLAKNLDRNIIPYEMAEGFAYTRKVFESVCPGQSLGVWIGPEGGFEEEEVEAVRQLGGEIVTLGRRILRTETAGIAVLSFLVYLLEGKHQAE